MLIYQELTEVYNLPASNATFAALMNAFGNIAHYSYLLSMNLSDRVIYVGLTNRVGW
jgi:hypothetical protein